MDKLFVCTMCGHVEFGSAPAVCPVCGSKIFKEDDKAIMPADKEGHEKHVPVMSFNNECGVIYDDSKDVFIKVGSVPHPMQSNHWIKWIDAYIDKKFAGRSHLIPESLHPAKCVHLKKDVTGTITAIIDCNLHGRWMNSIDV
jgi:superoxide reductase